MTFPASKGVYFINHMLCWFSDSTPPPCSPADQQDSNTIRKNVRKRVLGSCTVQTTTASTETYNAMHCPHGNTVEPSGNEALLTEKKGTPALPRLPGRTMMSIYILNVYFKPLATYASRTHLMHGQGQRNHRQARIGGDILNPVKQRKRWPAEGFANCEYCSRLSIRQPTLLYTLLKLSPRDFAI